MLSLRTPRDLRLFLRSLLMALLAVSGQTGCADDDFPKYVLLGGLRVLAIKADVAGRAEVSPGETVTLTPYVSDYGASRSLNFEAKACVDLGIAAGVEPTCDGVAGATVVASGPVVVSGTERTGTAPSFSVTIPADALASRSATDRYNGINYLVSYRIFSDDGAAVRSFKRVVVSEASKTAKNANPSLSAILGDGSALTVHPTSAIEVSAQIGAGSEETYEVLRKDQTLLTRREELVTTWFISDGDLKYFRTVGSGATTWTPGEVVVGRQPILVGVLRDDRGGISVLVQGL